jgi:(2Fe-2S) ferredoxin
MRTFRLSVCKGSTCKGNGSDAVYKAACEELSTLGLTAQTETRRGGCYGMCHMGPNVVVRENVGRPQDPFRREDYQLMGWVEESFYAEMTPEKIRQLIQKYIASGEQVPELLSSAPSFSGRGR